MEKYTYRVQWSVECKQYVGTCVEFPREQAAASTAREAIVAIEDAVAAIAAEYETPPPALAGRHYSGNFLVRTSPALHGKLVVEAAEQGVSLNQWLVQKLAGRTPGASLDGWF